MKNRFVKIGLIISALLMSFSSAMPVDAESPKGKSAVQPLSKAHAHNDYWHDRPLLDALDHGFTSVEADVWLKDGDLFVAHDEEEIQQDRTLKSLYLDPLMETVKNHGSVYPGSQQDFLLWIDIKSEDEATYKELHKQLQNYQAMLTKFLPSGVKPGSVTVIVSGNRPRTLMEEQEIRFAAYDGRMIDLGSNTSNEFMPVISDNWSKHFSWTGEGEMPEDEKEKLKRIVSTAHENGQIVRFWATPDSASKERNSVWKELLEAGVDLINSDDLPGLQEFLEKNDPDPTQPHINW
ncbi:phosphatidylinositol-specific phospholipase C/glycerophosphodiester phosphodiesterase family protein [Pseudalkalibacillus salsuginis]|uniref:phosphatidylinositol-specific phospholipase C/glycerophosphodiester phosphodiesterase family protein n=1 Tax=Pseudalkalibacillus salsuginis TaxID=2910972 RepID=UPI001F2BCB70|nr:phosphatidylinositol-specific phospholipase C/glycerophosphodiester phosphodiesterase family protein [Pseudalkalibacillus salsuginis]MCF6411360.1 phosphatidylinositol-specific phospholipase C/glycerophosphodiester phosphodiesterase family protein [Pseudalkalibacillus salsuginis]